MAETVGDLPARVEDLLPRIHVLRLPMVTKFRGITSREVVLFEGPSGWAEFSPFVEYGAEESSRWLQAALEFAGFFGDVGAESSGVAEPAIDDYVEVNATLPACPVDRVEPILSRFGRVGTVKAKVAEHGIDSLPEDLQRLQEFRRIYPDTILRLDANTGYSLNEALAVCEEFAAFDLQYFEQPVASVEDMARLRSSLANRGLPVVLAADESIRKATDPMRVAEMGAAEVVIVKVQPLGGIAPARAVIEACGLPAVVSSALESSVGLAAGAKLAATLPRTDRSTDLLGAYPACGLGTARFFETDVTDAGMSPVDGRIPVTRIVPDPDRLQTMAVSRQRRDWWLHRLDECWGYLRTQS